MSDPILSRVETLCMHVDLSCGIVVFALSLATKMKFNEKYFGKRKIDLKSWCQIAK